MSPKNPVPIDSIQIFIITNKSSCSLKRIVDRIDFFRNSGAGLQKSHTAKRSNRDMHIGQTIRAAKIVVTIDPASIFSLHAQQKIDAALPQLWLVIDTSGCGTANRIDSSSKSTCRQATMYFESSIKRTDALRFSRRFPCLLYTSPSPRDLSTSRMPSSA